ncbi:hypothetical protein PISMIDRAFT_278617 [Pisolithus microcarpus 441]|uniref:Uncharacterized protein n=1 Tax=Pisolithus microcarpus 441 TaxID=765257 RepID=A0A0C9YQJ3_9AGAM|nr:hypothetical protein PISMIDRAFT_278617 [Pisolithus microcarpus 441]
MLDPHILCERYLLYFAFARVCGCQNINDGFSLPQKKKLTACVQARRSVLLWFRCPGGQLVYEAMSLSSRHRCCCCSFFPPLTPPPLLFARRCQICKPQYPCGRLPSERIDVLALIPEDA